MQIDSEGEYTVTQVVLDEEELSDSSSLVFRRIKSASNPHSNPTWERWNSEQSAWELVASLDEVDQDALETKYLNEKHYQEVIK